MSAVTDRLQAALAAEQAIVYGYGVAGARLSGPAFSLATTSLHVHQQRRDDLIALIRAAGLTPVAAAPAYAIPFAVTTAATAERLAAELESGGAGAAWDLVAASAAGSAERSLGVSWLQDATLRIKAWGGAVPPLPGQPVPAG